MKVGKYICAFPDAPVLLLKANIAHLTLDIETVASVVLDMVLLLQLFDDERV